MINPIIDAHIHLPLYKQVDRHLIIDQLKTYNIDALISVSNDLPSAQTNASLAQMNAKIKPAFGFHPEQPLPSDEQLNHLLRFITEEQATMTAIGEVGLPYYSKKENNNLQVEPYIELLELFIKQTVFLGKPIVLHAVYEDAPIVCNLLEKYSVKKAHFHWFKGDKRTIDRLIENDYYISVTPDILYKERTRELVRRFPLTKLMAETDGPWPFEGVFSNNLTHPKMVHDIIKEIALIKDLNVNKVYQIIYENTNQFYNLV
ncbi:TatD family hydrolase [Virgibacillus sp. W0181]|uniref:TatD family hydrolase n=1 Tax=Virgibacillus sp. W0181 TaxID=3391581 RepID=UPI003F47F503